MFWGWFSRKIWEVFWTPRAQAKHTERKDLPSVDEFLEGPSWEMPRTWWILFRQKNGIPGLKKLWLSHWKWMGYMVSSGMMLCKCIILGRKQQTSGVDDLCFLWDLVRFFFEYVQAPYDWGNVGDRPRGILGVNQPPHQMRCGWPPWVLWLVGGLNLPIFQCG